MSVKNMETVKIVKTFVMAGTDPANDLAGDLFLEKGQPSNCCSVNSVQREASAQSQ